MTKGGGNSSFVKITSGHPKALWLLISILANPIFTVKKEDIITRVERLMSQGQEVLKTKWSSDFAGSMVDAGKQAGFRSASLSFISNLYGEKHTYYRDFDAQCKGQGYHETERGINILAAIKTEVESGWLNTLVSLVSADIFSDFLEMSGHLLENGYKDPAAVLIGSTLEEHLRKLCECNGIDVSLEKDGKISPKKADLLNADLKKEEVYGALEQKSITAWLDLRNKAAHGKYSEYSIDQVNLMLQGVTHFIISNPLA